MTSVNQFNITKLVFIKTVSVCVVMLGNGNLDIFLRFTKVFKMDRA